METRRLEEILSKFSGAKVAVVGDFFLDLYIHLERSLSILSIETHKEAFQAVGFRGQPGAAGVVTNNLSSLGAQPVAIGYLGKDGNGYTLRQALESRSVNTEFLVETDQRFTPTYTKPMMQEADGQIVELNRIDIVNRSKNPEALNIALSKNLHRAAQSCDGIIIVEQVQEDGYGTVSPLLRKTLAEIALESPQKPVVVDSRHFAAAYPHVSLKMNLSEAINAAHQMVKGLEAKDSIDDLLSARMCANLFWEVNRRPSFITLGDAGIAGISEDDFFTYTGYKVKGPIDIVGAGDSVLAGIGLALCVGASPEEAAYIGNLVGSITVQQLGTTGIATQQDIRQRHKEYQKQILEQE